MYYRITTFSYDPERENDVINWLNSVRTQMQSLPGVQYGRVGRVANGQSMMIGAYDTKQSADDAVSKVTGLRDQMQSVLNRSVEVMEGPVIWEIWLRSGGQPETLYELNNTGKAYATLEQAN